MSVKAIILRQVPVEITEKATPLLIELRSCALKQPGYISGETLIRVDDPKEHLVISTWDSLEHWNQWLQSPQRAAIQSRVDACLGEETLYQVYYQS
ncbi:antibiotic biosynthesis monooxygenase [Coraliomargarita sinensis]|uniref:Antibiotic biosynthesis monooxygenase n=1 Tax=Coraliomargarita sinensis TaxID=2174842 RepID=A0A317ZIF3_9BACT|nr:antibiotic biosynthesis monooxygenase [Coraliomargarita sinensis]PXA04077.1 antibiotic biosynthesis monooxygenase [Coraliomargarita sinensis]